MEQQSKVNALLSQNPWHYAYNYSIKKSPPTGATHNFWPRKSRGGCGEGDTSGCGWQQCWQLHGKLGKLFKWLLIANYDAASGGVRQGLRGLGKIGARRRTIFNALWVAKTGRENKGAAAKSSRLKLDNDDFIEECKKRGGGKARRKAGKGRGTAGAKARNMEATHMPKRWREGGWRCTCLRPEVREKF